jgi:hypothetical protein
MRPSHETRAKKKRGNTPARRLVVHTAPAACTPGHRTPDSANSSHCTPLRSGWSWLSAPRRLLPARHAANDTAGRFRPQLLDCPFLLCSAPVGLPGVASRAARIGREFPERVVVDGGVPKPTAWQPRRRVARVLPCG